MGRRWVAALSLSAITAMTTPSFATHGSWQDHYTSANHTPCCAASRDCFVVRARIIAQDADSTTAEVEGHVVMLPAKSVHQSEDLSDWACVIRPEHGIRQDNVRCLFVATGG